MIIPLGMTNSELSVLLSTCQCYGHGNDICLRKVCFSSEYVIKRFMAGKESNTTSLNTTGNIHAIK